MKETRGQVLVVVLILLAVLSILVPTMVMYAQNEAKWTVKETRNTQAFHLAEAGTEKALLELSLTTATWTSIQSCSFGGANPCSPPLYRFDQEFTDISGGKYKVYITSGPQSQQATVISVSKDSTGSESRAVEVIFSNASLGNVAIEAGRGVNASGNNMTIEWGGIVSPNTITPNAKTQGLSAGYMHPNFYSASGITGFNTSPSVTPHCDNPNCYWWHSYYSNIPPAPIIDFSFYKSSAQAAGVSPCGQSYYQAGDFTVNCSDTTGNSFYVEGQWTNFSGPVVGTIIVQSNFTTVNGSLGSTSITAKIPRQAWMQYCQDWAYYCSNYTGGTTLDNTTCVTYPTTCPGKNSTYLSPANAVYALSPAINGFLYVGGDFSGPNGGGNSTVGYGVMYVKGTVNLNTNSHGVWYYNGDVSSGAVQTTQIILSRTSWQDIKYLYP